LALVLARRLGGLTAAIRKPLNISIEMSDPRPCNTPATEYPETCHRIYETRQGDGHERLPITNFISSNSDHWMRSAGLRRRDGIELAEGRIDVQANFSCNISCET
jgi:hypothetical protein